MKYKIVEIEWVDAQSSLESWTLEELKTLEPLKTFSVGYLVFERKDDIILAFMDFGELHFKHTQVIPRGMIKKIKVIRAGTKGEQIK